MEASQYVGHAFWLTLPDEGKAPTSPIPTPPSPTTQDSTEQADAHGGLHLTRQTKPEPAHTKADRKKAPESPLTQALQSPGGL